MWFCAIGHILVVSVLVQISLSKFPIAVVSIFLNTGPILTVLLGGLLVRSEQVTLGTVLKAIAAFAGVLLITLGAPKAETADEIASSGSVKEAP